MLIYDKGWEIRNLNMQQRIPTISNIIMMGDSLSDRGTMYKRQLFGLIPMSKLSGLQGRSPRGRFTNGYVWSDHLSSMLINAFVIQRIKKELKTLATPNDIADAIITHHEKIKKLVDQSYSLDNDQFINFLNDQDFVRNYDEGGLTAHDYSWVLSKSISRFFSRLILSTLAHKRSDLLAYDSKYHLSARHKAQTLIIEWSGANDLITVNEKPSKDEADYAIKDRIHNIAQLINHGYRHFSLLSLPDLSLTPRYQLMDKKERDNAHYISQYFNQKLKAECEKLQSQYPDCTIRVLDINTKFNEVYQNPGQYRFDKEKLTKPFSKSDDFKKMKSPVKNTRPSACYMFWDDVHPTMDMQILLAEEIYKLYKKQYRFVEPEQYSAEALCHTFKKKYVNQLNHHQAQHQLFGLFSHSNFDDRDIIAQILKQASYDGEKYIRDIITELGWIDKNKQLNPNIPVLKKALNLKY